MSRFAEFTKVPVDQTRNEIERTLTRYGADRFAYFTENEKAIIVFEAHDRRIRFDLSLPSDANDVKGQERRRLWRALLMCIKAKLESVASGIETFETAFLAHTVMPDGKTVEQHVKPTIAAWYSGGLMTPLLPAPSRAK